MLLILLRGLWGWHRGGLRGRNRPAQVKLWLIWRWEWRGDGWSSGRMDFKNLLKIFWSHTNTATLRYVPAASGLIPGPTHCAAAWISDLTSSFELLLMDEILQHIVAMTNLQGRLAKLARCGQGGTAGLHGAAHFGWVNPDPPHEWVRVSVSFLPKWWSTFFFIKRQWIYVNILKVLKTKPNQYLIYIFQAEDVLKDWLV